MPSCGLCLGSHWRGACINLRPVSTLGLANAGRRNDVDHTGSDEVHDYEVAASPVGKVETLNECHDTLISPTMPLLELANEWQKPPIQENRQVHHNGTPIEHCRMVCATKAVTIAGR